MKPDPLAALQPLHAPPPVPWWPPAPGWWALAVLLAAALFGWLRHRRRHALRRAALRELRALRREPDPARRLAGLNALLKRYALVCWPAAGVAGLSGEAWLRFLDAHGGGGRFARGPGRVLAEGPYSADPEVGPEVFELARRWIRANRPGRGG